MPQTPAERNHDLLVANTRYLLRARVSELLLKKLYETFTMRVRAPQSLLNDVENHLKEPWK